MNRSDAELRSIRESIDLVGRLSDSIVRFGPFSIGIDGVLSWIPGVGELYSLSAGAFIPSKVCAQGFPTRCWRVPRSFWDCEPSATPRRSPVRFSPTCLQPTSGPPG
jgi:hypothetical protein